MEKILIIHNKYKQPGGEDVAVLNELSELNKIYKVEYLEFKNEYANIFSLVGSLFTGVNFKSNNRLKKKIHSFNPDIAYVHNSWFSASTGIFKILKNSNIKTLIKIHNFRFYCTKTILNKKHFLDSKNFCRGCGSTYKKNRLFNFYFKDSYLKSFMMFFYSKRYLRILRDSFFTILPITKFQIPYLIDIGVNEGNIKLNHNVIETIDQLQNSQIENSLVYAGRISEEKGVEDLIETFLSLDNNDYILKIIGDGPEYTRLKESYKTEKIKFIGNLTNKDTLLEISNCKGVVTNTKLYEGQPNLICEASMLSKPSIFPDTGGLKEFFQDDYQYIFNQSDKDDLRKCLEKFILNNSQNTIIGENCRVFFLNNINNEYLNRFKEIVS